MVPLRKIEVPFCEVVGGQRGRGFSALAQVFERTTIPFLRKDNIPAEKRVGADFLEFAVPEKAELLLVERTSRQKQRM